MLYHSKIHFCSRKFKTIFFVNFKKETHTYVLLFLCSNWFRKLEKTWINAGLFLLQTSKKNLLKCNFYQKPYRKRDFQQKTQKKPYLFQCSNVLLPATYCGKIQMRIVLYCITSITSSSCSTISRNQLNFGGSVAEPTALQLPSWVVVKAWPTTVVVTVAAAVEEEVKLWWWRSMRSMEWRKATSVLLQE